MTGTTDESQMPEVAELRQVGFTAEELDQLPELVVWRLNWMVRTRPRGTWEVPFAVGAAVMAMVCGWLAPPGRLGVLEWPGGAFLLLSGLLLAVAYMKSRFAMDAHDAFAQAGLGLIRAVGRQNRDQLRRKEEAIVAARAWRRCGPDAGVPVDVRFKRVFDLIGPDRTIPLPESEQAEIGAIVRATLIEAARH